MISNEAQAALLARYAGTQAESIAQDRLIDQVLSADVDPDEQVEHGERWDGLS